MNLKKKGCLYIISSVAGGGKSTLINMLVKKYPAIKFSVSFTTRSIRPGDEPGITYYFIERDEFEYLIEKEFFYEWAIVHDNYYGTPKYFIIDNMELGNDIILDIDVQGAEQVKKFLPEAKTIFIMPPSEEIWIKRLIDRKTDSEQSIQRRIQNGKKELLKAESYDYRIINDDLHSAFDELEKIIVP